MAEASELQKVYAEYKNFIEKAQKPENAMGYSFVWGFGKLPCDVVLIGEAPGKDEVEQGRPFVGKAGKILDEFLKKTGIAREKLFITNTIKYRLARFKKGTDESEGKLANRPAKSFEIETGGNFLRKELAIINPKIVVTMGNVPLMAIANEYKISQKPNIGELHGKAVKIGAENGFVLYPIYHPASLIYNRSLAECYEKDLLGLKEVYESLKK